MTERRLSLSSWSGTSRTNFLLGKSGTLSGHTHTYEVTDLFADKIKVKLSQLTKLPSAKKRLVVGIPDG
jgi:hypothetical protein